MSPDQLRQSPAQRPTTSRSYLKQVLALGLVTAGCARVDGALPERGQVHTFTADDPCLLDCLEGEMMTFTGKDAEQDHGNDYCFVDDSVCVVDDPNALIDQTVNVKMPITAKCGALKVVKADVINSPMPASLELGPKVTTFEWKVVGAERGECLDGGSDSDSGGETGGAECSEHVDCYSNEKGLCDKQAGECFIPTMGYAAAAVKGETEAIRTKPSTTVVVGTDVNEKDANEPNSPDGMNFGVYGGCYSRDGENCAKDVNLSENGLKVIQLPEGLGKENVVFISKAMADPNNNGKALCWTSDANDAFLQCDPVRLANLTDGQVVDANENLKIDGTMKILNPVVSAKPGTVQTLAVNYDVEQ